MNKILIVNGPNLNLLGTREVEIYGNQSFDNYMIGLKNLFPEVQFDYFQSNIEGELVDCLQNAVGEFNAVVLNAAGYSHTSVALADTIATINLKVIEVHISNIYAREEFRHKSLTGKNAVGVITGFGLAGYEMAVSYLISKES